ncbi:hypothetical protein EDB84DRAFT_1439330 [Lactarius hengduanensis]|nr:hypothetical protein EDB84DRAFT_1439330 [Lactarius hengduanensis]
MSRDRDKPGDRSTDRADRDRSPRLADLSIVPAPACCPTAARLTPTTTLPPPPPPPPSSYHAPHTDWHRHAAREGHGCRIIIACDITGHPSIPTSDASTCVARVTLGFFFVPVPVETLTRTSQVGLGCHISVVAAQHGVGVMGPWGRVDVVARDYHGSAKPVRVTGTGHAGTGQGSRSRTRAKPVPVARVPVETVSATDMPVHAQLMGRFQ